MPFTTKVVSSKPVHGEVYSIQYYVIKFVSDLGQVGGFLLVLWFPPPIKIDCHNITEILFKVALNTINHQTINQTTKYYPVYSRTQKTRIWTVLIIPVSSLCFRYSYFGYGNFLKTNVRSTPNRHAPFDIFYLRTDSRVENDSMIFGQTVDHTRNQS